MLQALRWLESECFPPRWLTLPELDPAGSSLCITSGFSRACCLNSASSYRRVTFLLLFWLSKSHLFYASTKRLVSVDVCTISSLVVSCGLDSQILNVLSTRVDYLGTPFMLLLSCDIPVSPCSSWRKMLGLDRCFSSVLGMWTSGDPVNGDPDTRALHLRRQDLTLSILTNSQVLLLPRSL